MAAAECRPGHPVSGLAQFRSGWRWRFSTGRRDLSGHRPEDTHCRPDTSTMACRRVAVWFCNSRHLCSTCLCRFSTIKDWELVEFKDQKTDTLQKKLALIVDDDQKFLLNKENTRTLIDAFGTQETDEWVGRFVEVYFEPNVTFGGKRVGGLRVRIPYEAEQAPFSHPAQPRNEVDNV